MGNFANTLFSVLLGWVQRAAAWLWSLIGADGAGGLMGWVLDNWLALAIALCILGLTVDVVVYLLRWQPYRVWRSFFGRKDEEDDHEAEAPAEEPEPLQWVYANGVTSQEPFYPYAEETPVTPPAPQVYQPVQEMPSTVAPAPACSAFTTIDQQVEVPVFTPATHVPPPGQPSPYSRPVTQPPLVPPAPLVQVSPSEPAVTNEAAATQVMPAVQLPQETTARPVRHRRAERYAAPAQQPTDGGTHG